MALTKISPEVLLFIIAYLKPQDVINLGRTCRLLRKINKDKILWKQLAYQMCLVNGILIPHDLDKLSLKEYMHMATGPDRILKLLHSNRQPLRKSDDESKYIFPTRISKLFSQNDSPFKQLFLVPGGRYMLTLALDDVFCFWDLRPSPKKHPLYLKQWTHSPPGGEVRTLVPTFDQRGLRVVVDSIGCVHGFNASPITVYEMTFGSNGQIDVQSYSAALEGGMIDEEDNWFCALIGHRLAHISGSVISVWDYKHDKFTRWDAGIDFLSEDTLCREVIFDGDRLWVLYDFKLSGWTLPQPRDLEAYLNKPAEVLAPEFTITMKYPPKFSEYNEFLGFGEEEGQKGLWMSSQDWYRNLDTPLCTVDILWTQNGNDKVTTYSISDIYTDKPTIHTIKPTYTMKIPLWTGFYSSPRETIDYIMHCGEYLVKPLYSLRVSSCNLHLLVTPRLGTETRGLKSFRAALSLDAQSIVDAGDINHVAEMHGWMRSHLFDPVGGKACVIHQRESPLVLVMDYLDF